MTRLLTLLPLLVAGPQKENNFFAAALTEFIFREFSLYCPLKTPNISDWTVNSRFYQTRPIRAKAKATNGFLFDKQPKSTLQKLSTEYISSILYVQEVTIFYIVTYNKLWVSTSLTYNKNIFRCVTNSN